jgi:tetratricopeptide (TPR) repeat protein
MSRLRRILIGLVLVELAATAALLLLVSPAAPLPVSEHGTQELGLVEDLRAVEAKHEPGEMQSWLKIGDFYCSFGLLPEAEYCLEQAALLGSLDEDGILLRGIILSRLGRIDEARQYFRQVIDSRRDGASDVWIQLALDALRQNDPQQAEQALRQSGNQPIAQLALARLLMRTERAAEAITVLDRLLEDVPGSLRALQLKSWAHERLGHSREARENYELSLRHVQVISMLTPVRLHDEQMHQRYGPGRLMVESGRLEQQGNQAGAVEMVEQAIEQMRPLRRFYHSMRAAQLYLETDNPRRALKHLRQVLVLDGESAEIWELVGNAWLALGEKEKAQRAWLEGTRFRASKFMPANQYLHQKLADSFAEAGEDELAQHHRGLMHYEKGRLAWRENDLRTALVSFTEAVNQLPMHASSWYYLAETRRAENDREGARDAYQQCLQQNANHGRARVAMALLDAE